MTRGCPGGQSEALTSAITGKNDLNQLVVAARAHYTCSMRKLRLGAACGAAAIVGTWATTGFA